jgi:signal transduction histidine kinase
MSEQLATRLHALEANDALMSTLLESINEGVVAVSQRGTVVRMNEVARRLLAVDQPSPFPSDRLPQEPVMRAALREAMSGVPAEPREMNFAGRTLAVTGRPLPGGGAVLAVLDLTTRRRLETIRRDFVANASHELKTPLTVISGFAETLLDMDLSVPQRQQFVGTIQSNVVRMQRIVDDLLDLARYESGGWVPNPVDIDVKSVASDALALVQSEATRRHLELRMAIADNAGRANADPTALRQILQNLVENAVRYTQAGSVTVFAQRESGGTVIGVRDTGIGIPREHLPRIFERFYRVDAGRSREVGGTGLGLAIVKHLAEAHGGKVRAASSLGAGTEVAVLFPDR